MNQAFRHQEETINPALAKVPMRDPHSVAEKQKGRADLGDLGSSPQCPSLPVLTVLLTFRPLVLHAVRTLGTSHHVVVRRSAPHRPVDSTGGWEVARALSVPSCLVLAGEGTGCPSPLSLVSLWGQCEMYQFSWKL